MSAITGSPSAVSPSAVSGSPCTGAARIAVGDYGGVGAFVAAGIISYSRIAGRAAGARWPDSFPARLRRLRKLPSCPSAVIQRSHLPAIWGAVRKNASATSPQPARRLRRHHRRDLLRAGEPLIGKLPVSFRARRVFTDFPDTARSAGRCCECWPALPVVAGDQDSAW